MTLSCWDCHVFEAMYDFPCPMHCTGPQRKQLDDEMNRRLRQAGYDIHQLEKALSRDPD